jgi:ABC-type polysaccharide transport system permease subunit
MKTLISKTFNAIVIIICTLMLGISVPMIVSILLSLLTPATFVDCTNSVPFWLFTIIGTIISGVYVNNILED